MTAALSPGRYTGGWGTLSIYIGINSVLYTSLNTGTFSGNCNYYGDFIDLTGTFVLNGSGTAEGAEINMQSIRTSGNRVKQLSIGFKSMDPAFELLEGYQQVTFTDNTLGNSTIGVRRMP